MEHQWLRYYDPNTPHTLTYPAITLDQLLDDAARDYPDYTAMMFVLKYALAGRLRIGATLTYRRLREQVDRLAAALAGMGVRKGDRIAVMLPNSPEFVIAFYAAMRLGAIVVNTNPTYTAPEIQHQLEDSGAETIVLLNILLPRLRAVQAQLPRLRHVIVTSIDESLPFPMGTLVRRKLRHEADWIEVTPDANTYRFGNLLAGAQPLQSLAERSPDDVALFQYTGGTTGVPKAAMLTHRNLVSNTLQAVSWLPDKQYGGERIMCALPFFHIYGMTIGMLLSVALASNMIIVPNPRPIDQVMRVLQRERATIFPGVPAMYIGIINHPDVATYDLKSVRFCLSAAAPLPMEVQETFGRLTGGRLVEGYGLTEASPLTHANPVYGVRKPGSIGIPVPDTEARLVNLESGIPLPIGADEAGELAIRGPQVMQGYWNRPEDTAECLSPDGWLRTGDIAKVDADGYFAIVDRKKDMIIASGYKVLPREIEDVLYAHPGVQEAAVAGIPDPYRGETVKAYIVPKAGAQPTEEQIIEHCRASLAPYKIPKLIEFRAELPKTTIGKVLRRVLVEQEKQKLAQSQPPLERTIPG